MFAKLLILSIRHILVEHQSHHQCRLSSPLFPYSIIPCPLALPATVTGTLQHLVVAAYISCFQCCWFCAWISSYTTYTHYQITNDPSFPITSLSHHLCSGLEFFLYPTSSLSSGVKSDQVTLPLLQLHFLNYIFCMPLINQIILCLSFFFLLISLNNITSISNKVVANHMISSFLTLNPEFSVAFHCGCVYLPLLYNRLLCGVCI